MEEKEQPNINFSNLDRKRLPFGVRLSKLEQEQQEILRWVKSLTEIFLEEKLGK